MDIPRIEGLSEDQVLTLAYCRTYKQFVSMIEGYRAGKCPFCDPLDQEKNRLVRESGAWRMWLNPFPMKHTKPHLVLAPTRHVAPGGAITAADFTDMGELFLWAQKEYGFTGGGFAMRFGSPKQSAGTVLHLHANIIIPDLTGPVDVTLAKEPAKTAEQLARMTVFEKIRRGLPMTDLDDRERLLIDGCI